MKTSRKIQIPSSARSAFSLIELLVVVAIIALLVAILIPTLSQARHLAKNMLCATNQHQIAVAWNMYLSDNDDTFPRWRQNIQWFYGGKEPAIVSGPTTVLDFRPLNPYVLLRQQNQQWAEIFRCPADRPLTDGQGQLAITNGYPTYEYFGNSYFLNWLLLLPWDRQKQRYLYGQNLQLKDVELSPWQVVLLGDCQWYYTANGARWDAQFHAPPDHMNLAFLDGHVAFTHVYRPDEIATGALPDYNFSPYLEDIAKEQ